MVPTWPSDAFMSGRKKYVPTHTIAKAHTISTISQLSTDRLRGNEECEQRTSGRAVLLIALTRASAAVWPRVSAACWPVHV